MEKSARFETATAGAGPYRARGMFCVIETARNGVDDGQSLRVPQRLERGERRVQAEEAVQVNGRLAGGRARALRLSDPQRRAQTVITAFAVWHDHVQPVHRAPL